MDYWEKAYHDLVSHTHRHGATRLDILGETSIQEKRRHPRFKPLTEITNTHADIKFLINEVSLSGFSCFSNKLPKPNARLMLKLEEIFSHAAQMEEAHELPEGEQHWVEETPLVYRLRCRFTHEIPHMRFILMFGNLPNLRVAPVTIGTAI